MPKPHQSAPLDTAERPGVAFVTPSRRLEAAAQIAARSPDLSVVGVMPSPAASSAVPPGSTDRSGGFPSVSRTKITAPLLRQETLTRDRLIDWLRDHVGHRLTLVIAEAGYGKTTLLADFGRHSQVPVLWFKLDHTDRDWITLSNYLIAAFRELRPGFGTATMAMLGQLATADPPRGRILDSLMAEVASLDEPALLILDDFHLVDDSPDAREIVGRILGNAPSGLSVVIATRRRPEFDLGRARAQGDVAELGTDDLRFSRAETNELFSDTYQQPLEPDVLDQLERRTEGWAASLQLFRSSIRGRSALEIRSFVRSLNGTDGPIYDFLAQEVLRELTPILRRFVIGASILERIVPNLIAAIFADDAAPPSIQSARSWIEAADDLGLMGRRGESGRGYRFHPLLREFLLRQLAENVPHDVVKQRHLRVAVVAESDDWLTACHHYLEADEPAEAVRVLGESLLVAIGTGAWGVAAELLDRFPSEPDAPAVQVILALREIEEHAVDAALKRLARVRLERAPAPMRSLVRHAMVRAAFITGDMQTAKAVVASILGDSDSVPLVARLARSFATLYLEPITDLEGVARNLERLGADCDRAGLTYFAAISYHNALEAYRVAAMPSDGYRCGVRAVDCLQVLNADGREAASSHAGLAMCAAELGNWALADEHAAVALALEVDPDGDARHEISHLRASQGWAASQPSHPRRLSPEQSLPREAPSALGALARASLALSLGDFEGAENAVDSMSELGAQHLLAPDIDAGLIRASILLMRGSLDEAGALVDSLKVRAAAMGAIAALLRLEILAAVAAEDGIRLQQALELAAMRSQMALLDTADAVVSGLHLLGHIPPSVTESVRQQPGRWRQAAKARIRAVPNANSQQAAHLLGLVGGLEDLPLLRAFERIGGPAVRTGGFARRLAERASPPLELSDLGATSLSIGLRTVAVGEMRRKAAALLLYLACRPHQTATRERVLDDLWPKLSPLAASNSLNQTLYFLRRGIDPWYEDGLSVDYVRNEAEVLTLPSHLVRVASVEFHAGAQALLKDGDSDPQVLVSHLGTYVGRFAPEFEYEEWSLDWRELLHSTYLDLVISAQRRLARAGDAASATAVGRTALAIDPRNLDLHEAVIWSLAATNSRPAAAEQYSRYRAVYREELGVDPPTFDQIADKPFVEPRSTGGIRH